MNEQTDTRQHILAIATERFALCGFEGVGIQELVDLAGIKKPTLYYWFQSKNGVLDACFSDYGSLLIDRLKLSLVYNHDIRANIQNTFSANLEFAEQHSDFMSLFLASSFAPKASQLALSSLDLRNAVHNLYAELFVQAVPDHGNMANRQEIYAYSLSGSIQAYVSRQLSQGYKHSDDEIFKAAHTFMHGIFS